MAFGALTMFNTKNDRALMLGIGSNLNTDIGTLGIDARLGYKFKNNFYIQGEYLRSSDYYYYSGNENHYINWGVLIHFGYNIGGLF